MSSPLQAESSSNVMRENRPKILHVMHFDKFVPPFIDFLQERFADFDRHLFFSFGDEARYPIRRRSNTLFASDFGGARRAALELVRLMNRAEKIILHGLFSIRVVQLLAAQPWLFKKCYWVIWGGDLYYYKHAQRDRSWYKQELFRRFVIKRLGHLVTFIEGDVDLARQWYGARGQYHECLMYPSNLYKEYAVTPKTDSTIHIQIGNSADPHNEHFEMLQMLERYKHKGIRIYAPLSYGDSVHALKVAEAGAEMFGEKFVALTDFMPFDEYLRFLGTIDIAVFNHRGQQGMGNTITLLGLGKKVFLRADVNQKLFFDNLNVKLFNTKHFDLELIDDKSALHNRRIIKDTFSEEKLIMNYVRIFQ